MLKISIKELRELIKDEVKTSNWNGDFRINKSKTNAQPKQPEKFQSDAKLPKKPVTRQWNKLSESAAVQEDFVKIEGFDVPDPTLSYEGGDVVVRNFSFYVDPDSLKDSRDLRVQLPIDQWDIVDVREHHDLDNESLMTRPGGEPKYVERWDEYRSADSEIPVSEFKSLVAQDPTLVDDLRELIFVKKQRGR